MRGAAILLALLFAVTAPKERDLSEELLGRVEPRIGVEDGSLAVVPLVLAGGVTDVTPFREGAVEWAAEKDADFVRIEGAPGKGPIFVPGGLLLHGDVRERLLSRPLLVGDEPIVTEARFADRREKPVEAKTERTTGAIAPLGQRKLDLLLREEDALADLLRVQAFFAGVPAGKDRVADLFTAPIIAKRVKALEKKLAVVPESYAGGATGYVAFFGFRPVEVVCFRSAKQFQRLGGNYLRALAVSSAIWDEGTGYRPGSEKPDAKKLVSEAGEVLKRLSNARIRKIRGRTREKGGGPVYLVVDRDAGAKRGVVREYGGRLLVDAGGWPVFLEAFDYGGNLVFPTPLVKPGGRPVDEMPQVKSGAMTQEFLIRLAARRGAIRAALGAAGR
jgi:hypothetical protein